MSASNFMETINIFYNSNAALIIPIVTGVVIAALNRLIRYSSEKSTLNVTQIELIKNLLDSHDNKNDSIETENERHFLKQKSYALLNDFSCRLDTIIILQRVKVDPCEAVSTYKKYALVLKHTRGDDKIRYADIGPNKTSLLFFIASISSYVAGVYLFASFSALTSSATALSNVDSISAVAYFVLCITTFIFSMVFFWKSMHFAGANKQIESSLNGVFSTEKYQQEQDTEL